MLGKLSKYCSGKRLEINKYLTELGLFGSGTPQKQTGGKMKRRRRQTKKRSNKRRKTQKRRR
tara:strand:+ start:520 stop:705 length:186 start_codon:yes stop_codon:yes gene_type:complete